MPLKTESGREYQYSCGSCEYSGDEYDRKPTAEQGKKVRCPECRNPHLSRILV